LDTARQQLAQANAYGFNQLVEMLGETVVAFYAGEWSSVAGVWMEACDRHRLAGNREGLADFAIWLGQLLYLRGELDQSAAVLREALEIAVAGPHLVFELRARAQLALLGAESGDLADVAVHSARCQEVVAAGGDWRGLAGRVALAEAVVRAGDGDQAGSAEHFAHAQHTFQRYTLPWEEAETLRLWGRAACDAGEAAHALAKWTEASATYDRIGAATCWRDRVRTEVARAESRVLHPSPRRRYPDGLSDREADVLRLLAVGRTNAEIAAALVVSTNTVAFHVKGILNKTGAANRTEAAAYAHRHGIVSS
jgi:DNA-binding CsgD family transcriptional regulator